MKYRVSWIDATSHRHTFNEMKRDAKYTSVEYRETGNTEGDGWVEFEAIHTFEANSDKQAISYVKEYDFGGRDVEIFTLKGVDSDLYWTEEDWNMEERGTIQFESA